MTFDVLTDAQRAALAQMCADYRTPFDPESFRPSIDLAQGWVEGWVGPVFVGCSPAGDIIT